MRAYNLLLATVLVVLLQFARSDSADNGADCSKQANGVRLVDPSSCTNFILCYNQRPVRRSCPRGLYFDDTTLNCNYAALVKCSRYPGATTESNANDLAAVINDTINEDATCNCQVTTTCPPCSTKSTDCVNNTPCTIIKTNCNQTPTPCITTNCNQTPTPCTTTNGNQTPTTSPDCNKDNPWHGRYNPYPYPPPPPQYPYWQLPWQVPCWTPCTTPCPTTTTTTTVTITASPTGNNTSTGNGTALFVADQTNRRKFYVIQNGNAVPMKCSLTQWFDEETKTCRNKSYFKKK